MKKAVIVSAVRTGVGKYGGQWSPVTPEKLAAAVIAEAVKRAAVDPSEIEDLIMGNLYGQHGNIARVAALEAGMPLTCCGITIDRQCASSLHAVYEAAMNVMVGNGDVYVACGLEHMTREPWQLDKPTEAFQRVAPEFVTTRLSPDAYGNDRMGVTAENVAKKYNLQRAALDAFAVASHNKAEAAIKKGVFKEQILPVEVQRRKETLLIDADEPVRFGMTLEAMGKLKPAFSKDGVVTAGNACPWSDGAAAVVIMSEERAKALGIPALATVKSFAVAGNDPRYMGIAPIYAVPKALKRAGLTVADLDLIELNEAFAAQAIPCMQELNLPEEKINPNGGGIALGHPLGATGAILTTKAVYDMRDRNLSHALLTMCVGGGQGAALVISRD